MGAFADKFGNAYALAVVNVKLGCTYKLQDGKFVNFKARANIFIWFSLNGIYYVEHK